MNRLQNNLVPLVPLVQGTNSTKSTKSTNEHRYSLEKGSKKYQCPNCNKKTFVKYIDIKTGDYLPEQYGRCDRESKCSYHLNPYLDGYTKTIWEQEQKVTVPQQNYFHAKIKPKSETETFFFDFDTFKQTLTPERYEKNIFIQNLFYKIQFPFEIDEVTKVIELYRLGTVANGYRAGANTFPFIDIEGNVRAVQVKQFDEQNHTIGTDFLHSIIEKHYTRNSQPLPEWLQQYINQDKRISCLFGEHLLSKYHSNPVALVEAPKTAIYGTLYFGLPDNPDNFIWLAVYNKSSFSFDKLKVLRGRFVYAFPDLSKDGSTYKEWETKAKEYESRLPRTRFIFSDLLERLAPEQHKIKGSDLADFLIKQDWRLFRKQSTQEQQPQTEPEKVTGVTKVTLEKNILFSHTEHLPKVEIFYTERIESPIKEQSQEWSNEISELESYFKNSELPAVPFDLNKFSTIIDCNLFLRSHFTIVKANIGNRTFLPYLNRLQELKKVLTINYN